MFTCLINFKAHGFLLAFVFALMGFVQSFFALLSLFLFRDHVSQSFAPSGLSLMLLALLLGITCHRFDRQSITHRDAFLFAVLTWFSLGLMGSLPVIAVTGISVTDAVFESISAITTTGATVLSGLDGMPKTYLMYRQFLQWLGGLGVVIFVVAVLPMLNVGGMVLLKAETPGPMKDEKLAPRITKTAHYLWVVYLSITALCALAYYLAGMDAFDAIAHSLTTVSTGGFSTHDASMGYFDSNGVLWVANLFMLLGAISFTLHFRVASQSSLMLYWRDEETRWFVLIIALISVIITWVLLHSQHYDHHYTALNHAIFIMISFITSTGYGSFGVSDWPVMALLVLMVAGYMGGCAGSTAGGNKIIRLLLASRLVMMEMKQLIYPRGVFSAKYHGQPVDASVLSATIAFISIVGMSSGVLTVALMLTGLDFWTALSAVTACVNVLGPGFGELGNNFQPVSDTGIWILNLAMIMGRLEYLTLLVLFLPSFWRK